MIKQWGTFNVRSLLWLFVSGFSSIILQQGVFTASSLTATKTAASSVKDISSSRESCCHGNADPRCTGLTCQVKPGQSEPAHEDKTPSTVLWYRIIYAPRQWNKFEVTFEPAVGRDVQAERCWWNHKITQTNDTTCSLWSATERHVITQSVGGNIRLSQ